MYKERNHIKVFVSSTVYDFESQLDMVYSTLVGYGYDRDDVAQERFPSTVS